MVTSIRKYKTCNFRQKITLICHETGLTPSGSRNAAVYYFAVKVKNVEDFLPNETFFSLLVDSPKFSTPCLSNESQNDYESYRIFLNLEKLTLQSLAKKKRKKKKWLLSEPRNFALLQESSKIGTWY